MYPSQPSLSPPPAIVVSACQLATSSHPPVLPFAELTEISPEESTNPTLDVRRFVNDGFVVVPNVFDRNTAEACYKIIESEAKRTGTLPGHYKTGNHILQAHFKDGPFEHIMTPMFEQTLNELLGAGRWRGRDAWGWFSMTQPPPYREFKNPWAPPQDGWHVDSKVDLSGVPHKQALVAILLFNDVNKGDGGTVVSSGSHHDVTRMLLDAKGEMKLAKLLERIRMMENRNVKEITGPAGSVAFLHPHLIHAASANCSSKLRIIANPPFSLNDDGGINIDRAPGDLSALEHALIASSLR